MASERLVRVATYVAVFSALLMVCLKTYGWVETGSVSLLSSLVDSALDVAMSFLNLLAVRYAQQPPDDNHGFGHTSAEDLAALSEAAFIGGSGVFILLEAFSRFYSPTPVVQSGIGLVIMLSCMAITAALVVFQKMVVRKSGSVVIATDALHYVGDVLVNGAVILSLLLGVWLGWHWADPVFALFIAAYIFINAWKIGRRAFDHLMDHEFPQDERRTVEEMIAKHPGCKGFHALKTRRSGSKSFIQCHLELDEGLSLREVVAITKPLKQRLRDVFGECEVILQTDPR